jgi:hypothetical protein
MNLAMEIFNFNRANKSNLSDTHSGFRAFTREAYKKMRTNLKTTGMEFASEMLEIGIKKSLRIVEVPITYYPREGGSESTNPIIPTLSVFETIAVTAGLYFVIRLRRRK